MRKIFFLDCGQIADLRLLLDDATAEKRAAELARRDLGRKLGSCGHAAATDRERLIDSRISTLQTILKHA